MQASVEDLTREWLRLDKVSEPRCCSNGCHIEHIVTVHRIQKHGKKSSNSSANSVLMSWIDECGLLSPEIHEDRG